LECDREASVMRRLGPLEAVAPQKNTISFLKCKGTARRPKNKFLFFVLMAISAVILAPGRANLLHRKIITTSTHCLRIMRVSNQ